MVVTAWFGLPGSAPAADASGWQSRLAAELAEVHRAVERYRNHDVAVNEGWKKFGDDVPAMGEHWNHEAYPPQQAGEPLDLSRPMNLIYTEIGGRRRLVGLTYGYRLGAGEPMPQGFSGPLDKWHVHDFATILEKVGEPRPFLRWLARMWLERDFAPDGKTRLAMVHVWLDGTNPDGAFVDWNRPLAYRRAGLGPAYWANGTLAAAYGVALTHGDGCANELDGKLWIGAVGRKVKRELHRACDAAVANIVPYLDADPARLNAVAAREWCGLDALRENLLTSDQKHRIAAMVEHGDHHHMHKVCPSH